MLNREESGQEKDSRLQTSRKSKEKIKYHLLDKMMRTIKIATVLNMN